MSPGAFWCDRTASKTRAVFRVTPTIVEQADTPRVIALTFSSPQFLQAKHCLMAVAAGRPIQSALDSFAGLTAAGTVLLSMDQ